MFKNVKNNNEVEYVDKDEIEDTEKTYKYHIKVFDGKLAEQQKKIEEIVDFISAKFGEDCLDSDINNQVKKLENSLAEVETKFKKYIEGNSDILRGEIDNKNKKIYDEIENIKKKKKNFYEKYFSELEKNENIINNLKELISQKDLQVAFLETKLDDFIKKNEEYKNTIKEEFKDTEKKIDKINYMGITRKFEKMLKDKYKSNDNEIDEIKNSVNMNYDDLKSLIDINESNTTEKINSIFEKELPEIRQSAMDFYTELGNENVQNKNNIENIFKNINKNEDIINNINIKLKEQSDIIVKNENEINDKLKEQSDIITKNENEFNDKLKEQSDIITKNENEFNDKLKEQNDVITKNENYFNIKIKEQNDIIIKNENKLNIKFDELKNQFENALDCGKDSLQKEMEQLKQSIRQENTKSNLNNDEKFKNIVEATKITYGKLDKRIKEENSSLKETVNLNKNAITALKNNIQQDSLNTIQKIENAENSIELLYQSISSLEEKYNSVEQMKNELIENKVNKEDNDNNLKKIGNTIKDIRFNFDKSINEVKKDIMQIKEDTNKIKLQEKTNNNSEEISKNYNQYVKKVENVIDKVNKSIINIQENNKEQNKNLQLKIKAYIDNRNTNTINQLKETINRLNLSIIEKEKAQKIEMEELLNKKIKEIQKENERILKKKIEELNNQTRNNFDEYNKNSISLINEYKPTKRGRKKIYDPVDDSINLKQTASNNKKLDMPKENKSQVLKFFFDDDDIN